MIKALLATRFRALFAGFTNQRRKKTNRSTGMIILFAFLYLYLAVVICGAMAVTFLSLAEPYHAQGLDWLYFAMAGLMALGFAVMGSVFSTQSQLYDAKDNHLLLSMPIPPWAILLSRMIPLLALNLLFAGLVFIPAMVVYAIVIECSVLHLIIQTTALLAITLIAQAIACLFGWLLHLMLSKLNKSFASMLYVVIFLVIYFTLYSKAGDILNSMAAGGSALAGAFQTWVWPLYAMGMGCIGNLLPYCGFLAVCIAAFCLVYWLLSVSFLRSATMQRSGKKRRKLDLSRGKPLSPAEAVIGKEWRKFIGCPVYLTNMGLGVIMTLALAAAGIFFREMLLEVAETPVIKPFVPLILCAILSFTVSTCCISTPSVSLEGKNIWILKSLPISSRQILESKLWFHCRACVPVTAFAGLALAIAYNCSLADCIFTALVPGLLAVLCGVLGMICGLKWAKLDYISEAYPCKQSTAVLVIMFGMMGVPLVLGLVYVLLLMPYLSPTLFMTLCCAVLSLACFGLYRLMITWGVTKWESL